MKTKTSQLNLQPKLSPEVVKKNQHLEQPVPVHFVQRSKLSEHATHSPKELGYS